MNEPDNERGVVIFGRALGLLAIVALFVGGAIHPALGFVLAFTIGIFGVIFANWPE